MGWQDDQLAAAKPWEKDQVASAIRPTQPQPQPKSSFTGAMELMAQQAGKTARAFGRGAVMTLGEMTGDSPAEAAYRANLLGLKEEKEPNLGTKVAQFVGGMFAPAPGGLGTGAARDAQIAAQAAKKATATRGAKTIGEAPPPLTTATIQAARQAHDAGYDLPAAYIGGPTRRAVETAVGKAKSAREISAGNEVITDRLAKTEIGLLPEQELSPENFDRLRQLAYKPYEAIRKVGQMPADPAFDAAVTAAGGRFAKLGSSYGDKYFYEAVEKAKAPFLGTREVDAGETLDAIRALRSHATQNLKKYDPERNALGQTQRELAKALEGRLERYAQKIGQPQLVKDMQAARVQLAKIEAVEDSLGASGHVTAKDFARMLDKNVPLSGRLKVIGETAQHFQDAVQPIAGGTERDSWSATDFLLGGTGLITGHPAAAAAVISKPLIRRAIQSEGAQKAMMTKLGKESKRTPSLVKRGAIAAAVSASTTDKVEEDQE